MKFTTIIAVLAGAAAVSALPAADTNAGRLARGLPSGSVLEFANSQMLADALEGRRTF